MENSRHRRLTVDPEQYSILAPIPPFVDICLQSAAITSREFSKIVSLAAGYPNDPRMIEMVRKAGDASAKVPYLLDAGETADSVLAALREVARPHIEYIQSLPAPVQATIHLLLSINAVPRGCENYAIPALLEVDRIQGQIVKTLRGRMNGRRLALDFHADNLAALQLLDREWPRLREEKKSRWASRPLPEQAQMQYVPFFDKAGHMAYVQETCVIVDAPDAKKLARFTPPILRRPLPVNVAAPATGSADWLLREAGKIGRHFTRALLEIIKTHLAARQVELEIKNYELINQHAQDALREFVEKLP